MKRILFSFFFLVPFITFSQADTPFSCEAFGYLFQNNPTDVVQVDLQTGTATVVANNLFGEDVSSGYNRADNYIWLIGKKTGDLLKVDKNWAFTRYEDTNLPKGLYVADIDANGIFYLYKGSTTIYRYDLNTTIPTQLSSLNTTKTSIADFAVSPIDGFIYGVEKDGDVFRFNPANGNRTFMGRVASLDNQTYGAVYFDGSGNLYLNGNSNGKIFQISHNSLTSGSPTASAVFFSQATKSGTNDGARCADAPLCKVGNTAPTLSATTLENSCTSTTANLSTITTNNTPNGTTLTWHSGSPTTNANKLSNLNVGTAGIYYATFYDATNDCYSAASTPFTVTINPIPTTPTGATVDKSNICIGESISLSASCSIGTVRWYANGSFIGNGSPLAQSPTINTNYTTTCRSTSPTCESNTATPISVTVNAIPTPPTISAGNTRICDGNSTTLTATGCTGTVTWSNAKTGISISEMPSTNTTYTATCTSSSNCTSGNSAPVEITVITGTGTTISIDNATICDGETANLSMDNCSGTINWFVTGSGTVIGTTATLAVSPSSSTTYNGTCDGNPALNCSSTTSSNDIVVNVNSKPTAPTTSITGNSTICSGESTTLAASGCAGGTIFWSNSSTGPSITVSPVIGTNTYNAICTINGCSSDASNSVDVIVKAIPNAPTSVVDEEICSGDETFLSGSCAAPSVLVWYRNSALTNLAILPESPNNSRSYRAVCVDGTCVSSITQARVEVTDRPVAPTSLSASPAVICSGKESELTANCATGNLTWFSDNTLNTIVPSSVVSPSSTTIYYASCVNGECKSDPENVTVTVNTSPTTPTALSTSSSICSGVPSNLVGTCPASSTIQWYNTVIDPSTLLGTGSPLSVSPTETTTYKATCKDDGNSCESLASTGIQYTLVNAPAQPTNVVASPSAICSGQSSTLTGDCTTGTLTWYSDSGLNTVSGSTVSPSATTTYYGSCVLNGCKSPSQSVEIQVTTTPTNPTGVGASNTDICQGESTTLNASCATGSVIWYSDVALTSIVANIVSPAVTSTYYVACVDGACKSASTSLEITVTPTPNTPTSVQSDKTRICEGESATLSASCASGTLAWYTNEGLTTALANTTISPSTTTTYYAVCESGACQGSSVPFTQEVNPKPAKPTITPASRDLCLGFSVTLTASGCEGDILWSTGATTVSILETPTETTDYTISCTNANTGCVSDVSDITKISVVLPPPNPSITTDKSNICVGETVSLSANNCGGTISWFETGNVTEIGTGSPYTVNPTSNTSYTATCTEVSMPAAVALECESRSAVPIAVNVTPLPSAPTVSSTDLNICVGEATTLTSTDCVGGVISWSSGQTGTSITVSPSTNTTYSAKCIVNGCESPNSNDLQVIVTPIPTAPTNLTATAICAGESSTLAGTCTSGTLTWYSDATLTTAASSPVSPTSSNNYYATCIQDNCESPSAFVNVIVTPTPSSPTGVSASPATVCANVRTELLATCASGEVKWYEESTLITDLGSTILNPTTSITYYVSCVNGTCKSTGVAQAITVNPLPSAPTLSATATTICQTSPTTITASGCTGSVLWSNSETTASITVTPISTTQYTAICTDANSCSSTNSTPIEIIVVVPPDEPTISAVSTSICLGTSTNLEATNCTGTVNWYLDDASSSFSSLATISVNPTVTSSYYAICESSSGTSCPSIASEEIIIEVKSNPTITDVVTPICNNAAASFLAFSTIDGSQSNISVSNALSATFDSDGRFGDNRAVWVVENIPNNTTFTVDVTESGCTTSKNYSTVDCSASASYPLDLLLFTGKSTSEGNILEWVVANEVGVNKFEIQKSNDAIEFRKIGTVQSINSTDYHSYSFVDPNPYPQNNYYRLISYDLDGTTSSSKIINIKNTGLEKFEWNVYPNPIHLDERTIYISTNGIEEIKSIQLFNIRGESLNFEQQESTDNTIPLRVGSLNPGSYFIKIITDKSNNTKKLIKSN
ncbi:Por secretion system C-terminal sorting domain-containing protein [Spirosomataceae bacterium TFI 002]|nr:Por secretion system C-terminal sorting domain-containing protein [Spirosomataceae bacterium TFI 002]